MIAGSSAFDDVSPSGLARREVEVRGARTTAQSTGTTSLVVVEAHGAGRIATVVLGSVRTWTLDTSTRPVVVVLDDILLDIAGNLRSLTAPLAAEISALQRDSQLPVSTWPP